MKHLYVNINHEDCVLIQGLNYIIDTSKPSDRAFYLSMDGSWTKSEYSNLEICLNSSKWKLVLIGSWKD